MIKGTNADCKILKTSISNSTATITCLIFSSALTYPSKSFQFYIKDDEADASEISLASTNIYWIDKINALTSNTNNINVNKYKEITLQIDISNKNTSAILDNRWIRNCKLLLINTEDASKEVAWSSEPLTLISDEFELPSINNLVFEGQKDTSSNKFHLSVHFNLTFKSKINFSFNSLNFKLIINLKTISTDKIIESKELGAVLEQDNEFISETLFDANHPFILEICIANNKNEIMSTFSKIVTAFKRTAKSYIKTKSGVKKIYAYYVASEIAEDSDKAKWLE